MRVLIMGATGMLGHKLIQVLSTQFEVIGTLRGKPKEYVNHPILGKINLIGDIFAENIDSVQIAISSSKPDVVINCIGIVKQLPEADNVITSIAINALLPHQLAHICHSHGIRFIHYSTDCVFSGTRGNYLEDDVSDANDLYGRTKFLGEVSYDNCLTLRTSLIGRELKGGHSLIEWFFSQQGKTVKGFKNAIFSGLTTRAHATILSKIISNYPEIKGIWHLGSDPINKYDLLTLVRDKYQIDITIEPDYSFTIDRSINADKFRKNVDIYIPKWNEMIEDMYQDEKSYVNLRRYYVNR
jgi:dTDP-4-dehydrorhamnose reductase